MVDLRILVLLFMQGLMVLSLFGIQPEIMSFGQELMEVNYNLLLLINFQPTLFFMALGDRSI